MQINLFWELAKIPFFWFKDLSCKFSRSMHEIWFSLDLPLFGLGPSSKGHGSNLWLWANRIALFHWTLDHLKWNLPYICENVKLHFVLTWTFVKTWWQKVPSIGHKILNIPLQTLGELGCDLCTTIILDENLPKRKCKKQKRKKTRCDKAIVKKFIVLQKLFNAIANKF